MDISKKRKEAGRKKGKQPPCYPLLLCSDFRLLAFYLLASCSYHSLLPRNIIT